MQQGKNRPVEESSYVLIGFFPFWVLDYQCCFRSFASSSFNATIADTRTNGQTDGHGELCFVYICIFDCLLYYAEVYKARCYDMHNLLVKGEEGERKKERDREIEREIDI